VWRRVASVRACLDGEGSALSDPRRIVTGKSRELAQRPHVGSSRIGCGQSDAGPQIRLPLSLELTDSQSDLCSRAALYKPQASAESLIEGSPCVAAFHSGGRRGCRTNAGGVEVPRVESVPIPREPVVQRMYPARRTEQPSRRAHAQPKPT
jgi:hypothetical protein